MLIFRQIFLLRRSLALTFSSVSLTNFPIHALFLHQLIFFIFFVKADILIQVLKVIEDPQFTNSYWWPEFMTIISVQFFSAFMPTLTVLLPAISSLSSVVVLWCYCASWQLLPNQNEPSTFLPVIKKISKIISDYIEQGQINFYPSTTNWRDNKNKQKRTSDACVAEATMCLGGYRSMLEGGKIQNLNEEKKPGWKSKVCKVSAHPWELFPSTSQASNMNKTCPQANLTTATCSQ